MYGPWSLKNAIELPSLNGKQFQRAATCVAVGSHFGMYPLVVTQYWADVNLSFLLCDVLLLIL